MVTLIDAKSSVPTSAPVVEAPLSEPIEPYRAFADVLHWRGSTPFDRDTFLDLLERRFRTEVRSLGRAALPVKRDFERWDVETKREFLSYPLVSAFALGVFQDPQQRLGVLGSLHRTFRDGEADPLPGFSFVDLKNGPFGSSIQWNGECFAPVDVKRGRLTPLTDAHVAERSAVAVRSAYDVVKNVPRVSEFVRNAVRVVSLRDIEVDCSQVALSAQLKGNSFGSASFKNFVGLVVFAGAENAQLGRIVEAVVHEAIHSNLYMVEAVHGDLLRGPKFERPQTSPWTGNTIPMSSLAQACFVWYGLYWFWLELIASERFSVTAAERSRLIEAGFVKLAHVLPKLEEALSTDAFRAVHEMTASFPKRS